MDKLKEVMEIKRVPFTKLLKLELPSLAKSVIEIVGRHSPEELNIDAVYDLLLDEKPRIEKLNAIYGVHPVSVELKPKREELMLKVSDLKLQVRLASKINTDEKRNASAVMKLAVDTHMENLRKSKNEKIIHARIGEFLSELTRNVGLMNAVVTLGLNDVIDNLTESHAEVQIMLTERLRLKSLRSKESTLATTKALIVSLNNLFKQIEVAQLKYPALNYKPLFNELNDVMNVYRNLINIRASFNKRKAEEKKAMENGGMTDNPEESTNMGDAAQADKPVVENDGGQQKEPEVTELSGLKMTSVEPEMMMEDGKDNDVDQRLDQKKVAASGSNSMQLPGIENKTSSDE